jgi:hypothetical protein
MVYASGWSTLWTLVVVFGIVIPAVRWGLGTVGFGPSDCSRWRRIRSWGGVWAYEGDERPLHREVETLREELDRRLGEVDALQSRVAELEDRLDFAERLLTERSDRALARKVAR